MPNIEHTDLEEVRKLCRDEGIVGRAAHFYSPPRETLHGTVERLSIDDENLLVLDGGWDFKPEMDLHYPGWKLFYHEDGSLSISGPYESRESLRIGKPVE